MLNPHRYYTLPLLFISFFTCAIFGQAAVDAEHQPSEGYDRRLDAYGISIEATDQVDNDWLYFSALVFEHMTDHETEYDIRNALEDRGFRILLAGPDQPLNELPEYEHDPAAAEAGGLGGNPDEYRIALRTFHPHVLIHELAHGIYHTAIQFQENNGSIDPEVVEAPPRPGTFTYNLHSAYDDAMDAGIWRGTYFEAHADEYWAEGVALWFRTPPRELIHELDVDLDEATMQLYEKDPRAFLEQHDPKLHALVAGVFPDSDWWPLRTQIVGPDQLPLEEGQEEGILHFAEDLQQIAMENVTEALDVMSEVRFDIIREEGMTVAREVFSDLRDHLDNPKLHEYANRIVGELNDLRAQVFDEVEHSGLPDFEIRPIPEEGPLSAFRPSFVKYTDVFGVKIVATERTDDDKVVHAANVLAEYLDNNEDGAIDDEAVHRVLIEGGAFLVMFDTERERRRARIDRRRIEREGFQIGQDLYGEETLPNGPPHVNRRGRFDGAIEEVLHLVSNGWCEAYPDDFGYEAGSRLTDAMDLARAGRFYDVPRRYPPEAWYHYDDTTCDYECMAAEYLYWALTSLLNGQNYPGRAEEIAVEWECPTPDSLRQRDSAVYELLTDEQFALPKTLPDGKYQPMRPGPQRNQ